MKNRKFIYCLTALACICFINCENPIMKKWWEEPESEYVLIAKMIPQVTYETVIEHEFVYKEIFVNLPPEVIHDTIIQEVPIYVTIIEKVPEYVYETIKETEYVTVYIEVEKIVPGTPTKEDIIQYIKEHPTEIINIIKKDPKGKEILIEIIKDIPPDEIMSYLTDEQIKYIIKLQPPQVILQTIEIIDIEYIIFAGSADKYNGPHGAGASTDLTTQEKNSNDTSVSDIAKALKNNSDYLIMLHGHANPTSFTEGEIGDLMILSLNRAKAVEAELRTKFKNLNSGVDIDNSRVSVSGYGGGKNLFGSNSTYAGLNRRVEMILIRVGI
ncbi:MAG: OmpA family protein [Treponema sp.]|nr:OmpA family protein [Treponema sp.]